MIEFSLPDFLVQNPMLDYALRIALSVVCGFTLGLERKIRKHPVGIRTLVLMCLSSCLLGLTSMTMSNVGVYYGDPTRIAAGVVTGIGFLGGGVIFRQGFNIRGLTTATIIFASAAMGLAASDGLYIPVLVSLVISVTILTVVEKIEHKFFPIERTKAIHIVFNHSDIDEKEIASFITNFGLTIIDTDYHYDGSKKSIALSYIVITPNNLNFEKLANKLSKISKIDSFSFTSK